MRSRGLCLIGASSARAEHLFLSNETPIETVARVDVTTEGAHVTAYDLAECETTGLLPAFGCELEGDPESEPPWLVDLREDTELSLTDPVIHFWMQPGCPFGEEIGVLGGEMILTPDNPEAIGRLTISGGVESTIGEMEFTGPLDATPEDRIISVADVGT